MPHVGELFSSSMLKTVIDELKLSLGFEELDSLTNFAPSTSISAPMTLGCTSMLGAVIDELKSSSELKEWDSFTFASLILVSINSGGTDGVQSFSEALE